MRGLFHEPLGVDFATSLARGLRDRLAGEPPEAMARVTLLVNTSRMARRAEAALAAGGATLLPRIGLVSDIAPLLPPGDAPLPEVGALGMRLRLTRLVAALLHRDPRLSPPAAAFDLAGSLQALLTELQEGRVPPDRLDAIDVGDLSEHWQRTLRFVRIATDWMARDADLTPAAAQDRALDRLLDAWAAAPPAHPVIVAGSTASRAPTRRLIAGVLRLPQGCVVLPGLDPYMPDAAWDALAGDEGGPEDHPQFRLAAVLRDVGARRADVPRWGTAAPACPARDRLLSLALRPAPATDAWREEGPALADVGAACAGVTLVAAPSPGAEAAAIATGLRAALAHGRRAALITPDRTLSRQVAAQLDRWGIVPDDSAGRPLGQTAPGRLLLHAAEARGPRIEAEALVVLLTHPLAAAGGDRAAHLHHARALEAAFLRGGPQPFPDAASVIAWAEGATPPRVPRDWRDWLCGTLDALMHQPAEASLAAHVERHIAAVERLAQGLGPDPGPLWEEEAGRAARRVMDGLAAAAGERGAEAIPASDYVRMLHAILSAEEVRDTYRAHPDVMIWGAIEARVRSADLVILGGLNDDVWPGHPGPDPWLNRAMRAAAGLAPPERGTGLSAHDFQQAASGGEIWLSRATRTAEADAVPSRWLNRLEGLLAGSSEATRAALAAMRARGDAWLATAARLDAPDDRHDGARAPRPGPRLPAGAALGTISVTAVETLIRDPYAVYARAILGLRAMPPLRQGPDARVRGEAVHDAMQAFSQDCPGPLPDDAADRLMAALEAALARVAPWPGARRLWLGKFARLLPDLLEAEGRRRALGAPLRLEAAGRLPFADPPFVLTARADRIDGRAGGAVAIYDYKTGPAPSPRQQDAYAKQLLLEAMMMREGAFEGLGPREVADLAYVSLGAAYAERRPDAFDGATTAQVRDGLAALMRRYADGQPFVARLAPDLLAYAGDYDHLSRRGEWADTDAAVTLPVGTR